MVKMCILVYSAKKKDTYTKVPFYNKRPTVTVNTRTLNLMGLKVMHANLLSELCFENLLPHQNAKA